MSSSRGTIDRILQPEEVSVGIICPLPIEVAAMRQMFDEHYSTQQLRRDPNLYHLGRVGEHNVVIAGLPEGLTGITSATTVAERLWTSFHAVKALLLVGIGGGVPTVKNDMRLGDVVVSRPDGRYGGVVQYDFGKSLSANRFQHTGALNSPPQELLTTLAYLKSTHFLNSDQQPDYLTYLEASQSNTNLKYPGPEHDILFEASYNHISGSDCIGCDKAMAIQRELRKTQGPVIHYGIIASANRLMRDSKKRDLFNKNYDERILCFEMEAAGLMNSTPCLVIRGISDYADSHKREDHAWHGYAAAAAAAFAKEFINTIPSRNLNNMLTVAEALASKERRRKIVNWLTPLNFLAQHNDLCSQRQQDTGCWFLQDKRFQSWVGGEYPVLFCPGIPGAGKTMIVSTVIDYLKDRHGDDDVGIAFVYYTHGRRYEQKPIDIYASILKQLVQAMATLPDAVTKLHDLHFGPGTRPTVDEIFEVLNSETLSYSRIFLVVDGLDECFESEMDYENRTMMARLLQLATEGRFSLMATSRPIPLIAEVFRNNPKIEIRASSSDLELFLQGRMHRLPNCVRKAPMLQSIIKSEIIKIVDGMFILARLHIASLVDKTTPRKIKDALKGLPRGTEALDEAYSGAMERINNQRAGFRRLAERVLTWITYAQRALTSPELLHALAFIPGENFLDEDNLEDIDELLSTCAGLVILDHESDRIRLVHYTAEEYLQNVRRSRFPDGQVDISLTCLTYLSFQAFGEGECHGDASLESRLLSYPFLSYSAVYWSDHVRETSDEAILEMSARLLQDGPRVRSILQVKYSSLFRNLGRSSKFPRGLNPLHIAASLGLLQVSKILIARGVDTNGRDEEGRSPLLWAVDGGYDELVKLLLENRANPQDEDRRGCRAVHYAARKGFLALVQSFSSTREDINRSDKGKQAPLHYAILNHQSPVIEFLLKHGADASAVGSKRRSALHMAIQGRDIDLVRSLLSSKANPGTSNNEENTPLHEAAKLGLYAAANLLLDYGAEVNVKNRMIRTPLHMAAMGGHEKTVEILIGRGATLGDVDMNHWTALDWAIESGHVGSVSKLWEVVQGTSNVESEPQKYFFRAAQKGDDGMIGYWLDKGAAINGADGVNNRTALHYAAMRGRTSIIPTLLRRGSDASSRDRNGSTPLFMAAQWWRRDTVSYFLTATRNDLTLTDNLGRTLLHLVVTKGWVEMVAKILDLGGRYDARDHQHRTPLHMAVIGNNLKAVEVLIQKGSSNAIQDLDGWSPSDWACWLGFKTLLGPLKVDYDGEKRNRLIIQRIEIGLAKVRDKLIDGYCLLDLAHCALSWDARDLAAEILADHGTQNPAWVCDICLKPRKHPVARSFCTICYDVDVCEICLRQKSSRFCHAPSDFLNVVFSTANSDLGRERWVDQLRKLVWDRPEEFARDP